ncbi:hypothetical protein N0K08_17575 [Acidovorax sp. Be4]|uniref:Uncharacterized protein n=1 Tax=Acidovorax bellezanensis TaxID=2976702 RepID=A0ABT2PPS7_9BURK|nr:hypothetical protein [Acidovorax sp. Be4]MCT9812456.1 hypothetical protein [Acidovorax sp. Be4]
MTPPTPALRCHDAEACALGLKPCPTPVACGCAPTRANANIGEQEKEKTARHYAALAIEASRAQPAGIDPVAKVLSSRPGNDTSTIDKAFPEGIKLYTKAQVQAVLDKERSALLAAIKDRAVAGALLVSDVQSIMEGAPRPPAAQLDNSLAQIAAVAACFGDDWPDVPGEPEVLRRVKWAARQLKAAQTRPPLTDERISEIDDETHFHESPDWPRRFARAIEAELGKAPAP